MRQETLLVAIVSGALCFVIGFGGGALLTRSTREKTKATIAGIEAKAQRQIQTAKAEARRLQNELKYITVQLKQAKNEVAAEKETHRVKVEERVENITTKSVDRIEIINKSMFGIYLGEKLGDIQKRFKVNKHPNQIYTDYQLPLSVHYTSKVVEDCSIEIYEDRVWAITVWLKDNTKKNFNILKQSLENEYRKYQIQEIKNNHLDHTDELQFRVTIDGIPILIAIMFTDNFTFYMSLPDDLREKFPDSGKDELSIQFIHLPLSNF